MNLDDRKYVIFDLTEVDTIDFSEVMQTSADTLRHNVAGTQSFVKYEGDQPPSVVALTTRSQEYTHEEIRQILATLEWTNPEEEV